MRYVSEYVQHQRYEGSGEDERGNESEAWGDPERLGIYAFNPGTTSEPFTPGHDRIITVPTIYVPSGEVVSEHDKITVRGTLYTVEGDPLDLRNPYSSEMDGIVVNLKVVKG